MEIRESGDWKIDVADDLPVAQSPALAFSSLRHSGSFAPSISKRQSVLLLAGLTLLGGILRFYAIGAKSIWLDEAFSLWVAHHPPAEMIDWLMRIDQHPPLYYLLLAGWINLFGDLQGAARGLSALCSTLTIPIFYLSAQAISRDRMTALLATLLLTLAPFHIRFAQETRMYALLTLLAAGAIYGAVRFLQCSHARPITPRDWIVPGRWRSHPAMGAALLLAICQAGVMWTHNTATVFFPLALNLPVMGLVLAARRGRRVAGMAALNQPSFLSNWLQAQLVALLLWLPWLAPFIRQARGVDAEFWIPAPDLARINEALGNFAFAHLPAAPWQSALLVGYLLLALLGLISLRGRPAWAWLLLSLWLTPMVGELLVSLRRPIFSDRTLIWTTLALYLLVALGVRAIGRPRASRDESASTRALPGWAKAVQAGLTLLLMTISTTALFNYYRNFEKEGWDQAAAYIAARASPDDLILFNATWVQLPFDYYFRHYAMNVEKRGVPSDLFDSGQLEPKMRAADLPYLNDLVAGRQTVWLIYSHDWYTDPDGLIPTALTDEMRQVTTKSLPGLQILRFAADEDAAP